MFILFSEIVAPLVRALIRTCVEQNVAGEIPAHPILLISTIYFGLYAFNF